MSNHLLAVPKQLGDLRAALTERQIGTGLFYRVPLHKHPAFAATLSGDENLQVSESLSHQVLSLPMGPDLSDEDAHQVADALTEALRAG